MSAGIQEVREPGAVGQIPEMSSFGKVFEAAVLDCINSNQGILAEKGIPVDQVRTFATHLFTNGYEEIRGSDAECRAVAVVVQGAIEQALAKMLHSGEIKDVNAVFLTPLPVTPLRKKGDTAGLTKQPFEEGRKYTLDMRENTVRDLREAGATITAAYSKESLEALQNEEGSAEQIAIWNQERAHPNVKEIPLKSTVEKEIVGALYVIIDKDNHSFYLPTQGIQARDASDGESVWKKWFTLVDAKNPGMERSEAMLSFIENHK